MGMHRYLNDQRQPAHPDRELITVREAEHLYGMPRGAFLKRERTDPTFPRSVKFGGQTAPRFYNIGQLKTWFDAMTRPLQPLPQGATGENETQPKQPPAPAARAALRPKQRKETAAME